MPNSASIRVGAPGAKQAGSEIDRLHDKFTRLQKQGAKGFAIGVGAAAAVKGLSLVDSALSAGIDFMGQSMHAASDLNEQMSKSGVVFGQAGKSVQAWSKTTAESMGLSSRAALEAAGTFGQFFTGAGQSQAAAAKMSEELVGLAADLASFNNIDPSDALAKLKSGLAGEAEPLRSVGVFLTEAAVKGKAMQMGLGGVHGELTEGEKILARYKLILEQTGSAQGDFALTADGVANSERKLNAAMEDKKAKLGRDILPLEKAWLDTQLGLVDALGGLGAATELTSAALFDQKMPLEDVQALLQRLKDSWYLHITQMPAINAAYDLVTQQLKANAGAAQDDARESAHFAAEADHAARAALGLGAAADTAADGLQDARDQAKKLSHWMGGLASEADRAAASLGQALFGPGELRNQAALTKLEIKDTRAELKKLEEIKHPTRPQQEDILELRLKLDGLQTDLFETDVKLATLGDKPAKDELAAFLESKDAAIIKLGLDAQDTAAFIASLGRRTSGGGSWLPQSLGPTPVPLAAGGIVDRPTFALLGEHGPEAVVPLSGRGAIGGTVNVTLNVQGHWTPAQGAAFARDATPWIATELRRRGIL
jgi:hypothetical protein